MDKITFGIATKIDSLKRKKYLYECIESVLKQDNKNWELIISDDNSKINVDYSKYNKYSNIKIYKQKKTLGIFKNFNFCLQKANGNLFLPLGDDDLLDKNFVSIVLSYFSKNKNIDLFCFNYRHINSKGIEYYRSKIKVNKILKKGKEFLNFSLNRLYSEKENIMFFCSVIKTSKLIELGGYKDFGMVTDIYLIYLYSLNCNFIFIEDSLIKIRHHNENASGVSKIDILRKQQIELNEYLDKNYLKYLSKDNKKLFLYHYNSLFKDHVNLLITFKNKGRINGIKDFFKYKKTIRHFIILFLGIIFGKKIHNIFILVMNFVNNIKTYLLKN